MKNLQHNARVIKRAIGCKLCAVIKANAYGHGLIECARALDGLVDYFAVSACDEALCLRRMGIVSPVLMLTCPEADRIREVAAQRIEFCVHCAENLSLLEGNGLLDVHIKVDSGMHRLGFDVHEVHDVLHKVLQNEQVRVKGIFSHYARGGAANDYRLMQQRAFADLKRALGTDFIYHIGASGALSEPQNVFDMYRCGLSLFGYLPVHECQLALKPVLSAQSRLTQIKWFCKGDYIGYGDSYVCKQDTLVGVVACGYGDGIRRALSSCGHVVIEGKRLSIIGNVCMDMFMVDLQGHKFEVGQQVDIICGVYSAEDMAHDANTIAYEIMTGFTSRARKNFLE